MLVYNSWDTNHKTPFGAVAIGTSVQLSVTAEGAEQVILHTFFEDIATSYAMILFDDQFRILFPAPNSPGLLFYRFEVIEHGKSSFYGPIHFSGGLATETHPDAPCYQLTIYSETRIPEWFSTGVMYQIYVDRFYSGNDSKAQSVTRPRALKHLDWNDKPFYVRDSGGRIMAWDFFGGNLAGVIEKLDYLKNMGITIIYLNPIFDSVSNHKYDTGDYSKIDPMYGDEAIFAELIYQAKQRNITIMLDGVFSHTGSNSKYFNRYGEYDSLGAAQSKDSPYYSWYTFKDFPNKYNCWWGVDDLPNVNELDPAFLDYLLGDDGPIAKWMRAGIGGWRLDVADELPDEFIKKLKATILKYNQDAVLLGEVWEDASNKLSYGKRREYILDKALDSVSNYPLRTALIGFLLGSQSGTTLANDIMHLNENYPQPVFISLMNMTGTHDTMRLFSVLGECPPKQSLDVWEQRSFTLSHAKHAMAKQRLALYYIAIFMLPGIPCIYYGDDVCVQGYEDPYNRSTYPWKNGDTSLHSLIASLANLRQSNGVLLHGSYRFTPYNDDVFCFHRNDKNKQITVYINRSMKTPHCLTLKNNNTILLAHGDISLNGAELNLGVCSAAVLG